MKPFAQKLDELTPEMVSLVDSIVEKAKKLVAKKKG